MGEKLKKQSVETPPLVPGHLVDRQAEHAAGAGEAGLRRLLPEPGGRRREAVGGAEGENQQAAELLRPGECAGPGDKGLAVGADL